MSVTIRRPSEEMVRSAEARLGPEVSQVIRADVQALLSEEPERYQGSRKCLGCNGYKGHWGYEGTPATYHFICCYTCGGTGKR